MDLNASHPVNFGFLKCGVYGLATTSKLRKAEFIFKDEELVNLKNMIKRSCKSDQNSPSFDLVVHSPELTSLVMNFTLIKKPADAGVSDQLRNMHFLSVHYDLTANQSVSYLVQFNGLLHRLAQNPDNRLRVNTTTNVSVPLRVTVGRCQWAVGHHEYSSSSEIIFGKDQSMALGQLIDKTCTNEWLKDTVNVEVSTEAGQPASGVLTFDILTVQRSERINKPTPLVAAATNRSFETTSNPQFSILLALTGVAIIVLLVVRSAWKNSKRRVYHVADPDKHREASVLP